MSSHILAFRQQHEDSQKWNSSAFRTRFSHSHCVRISIYGINWTHYSHFVTLNSNQHTSSLLFVHSRASVIVFVFRESHTSLCFSVSRARARFLKEPRSILIRGPFTQTMIRSKKKVTIRTTYANGWLPCHTVFWLAFSRKPFSVAAIWRNRERARASN